AVRVGFSFETRAVYYFPAPETFNGFLTAPSNQITLIWDPPVVSGIKNYKIKYLKLSDKLKGSGIWQELPPPPAVQTQFIPTANKWGALLNLALIPQFNTSFGEKYYLAVVPVNLNDEEICNPETIENPFTIQDNTSPKITQCQIIVGATDYGAGERTVRIQFSEMITFATATISSRNFDAVKISEVFDPLANPFILTFRVYLEALSAKVPSDAESDAENSNGDEKLLLPNDEAKKLWVGEFVRVRRVDGETFNRQVTAIIGGLANSIVWFSGPISGDVGNGAVEPHPPAANLLQAPNNRTLQVEDAAGKRFQASSTAGLTIGDQIQVVDPYSNTRKILTITSIDWNNDIITVAEDISDLKCLSTTGKQCVFRSLNPDVWVKVQAFDSSGNPIDSLADQCSIGPGTPVIW
ncbi:MAG: hypothetical protein ACO2PO_15485, partial [Candidatus Calescibacterium sp.]